MAEIKYLVRIANTDLDGNKQCLYAMTKIKGVGVMIANAVLSICGIDKFKKVGELDDASVKKIDEVLASPLKFGIPIWMVNRKSDQFTGESAHLLGTKLDLAVQDDIKFLRKIKCYRGVRHSLGQPVRGQRTRSNFRANKGKVMGVKKSSMAAPAKKPEGGGKKAEGGKK